MNGPFRGGMQVHAVPDDERVYDESTGVKLPWGYSYADASLNKSSARTVRETGPFGKPSARRSFSRTSRQSRTITPAGPSVDPEKLAMEREQDAVFGEWRAEMDQTSRNRHLAPATISSSRPSTFEPHRQPSRDLVRTHDTPDQLAAAQASSDEPPAFSEPTEVLLYGFLPSSQPAAIAFYESASRGLIYEDYDRAVANPRFAQSSVLAQTNARLAAAAKARGSSTGTSGLTKVALRRINEYKGGDHWIKVTFDSPTAAERALEASPHLIGGCMVHAEPWHGQGPREDVAISAEGATSAGTFGRPPQRPSRVNGDFASLPGRKPTGTYTFDPASSTGSTETAGASSNTLNGSSNTLGASQSSATATGSEPPMNGQPRERQLAQPPQPLSIREPKIRGARTMVLQPKESALMPVKPLTTQLLGSVPLIGGLVVPTEPAPTITSAAQEEVKGFPRKQDGSVDWAQVGWLWFLIAWLDYFMGSDICGIKDD